jgi:GrpB-like predicted nucleotidyltransferase (UPF0157 family)
MPRVARVVIPGVPHHVTQRGNNRQDVFFTDDDRRVRMDADTEALIYCGATFRKVIMLCDPVIVTSYDPQWPAEFVAEEARIRAAILRPALIEHIGSTAVPNLAAKPVIDIMIGLASLAEATNWIRELQALGYEYVPEYETVMPERRYFRRMESARRSHQIHMVERGGDFWVRHLAFRDFLSTNPQHANDYGRLKMELAARFRDDRDGYMDGKDKFIKNLEALAMSRNSERVPRLH